MKLIDYLRSIREESDKRKLLAQYLFTLNFKYKVRLETITQKFNISNNHFLIFTKSLPEIEIDGGMVKFIIEGSFLIVKRIPKKNELSKQKKAMIENILHALNVITGKGYRASSRKNQTVILARLFEGYVYDDFIHVIQGQAIRWLGTDSEIYLRPETLFGSKMDGYLNAPIPKSKTTSNKLNKINEAINSAKQFDWEANS